MPSEPSPAAGSLLLLLVAVAVLGLGPLFFRLSQRWRWLLPFIDGFVLASVGALAALFILPGAFREAGPWSIVVAGAGLLVPSLVEEVSTRRRLVHGIGLGLALAGLLVHTLTDGLALATAGEGDVALVLALILHRIPVGLAAWWIVRPLYGATGAWLVLALEGGGTVVGFFLGGASGLALEGSALALLQAFVAGALLHVVLHRHPTDGAPWRGWHFSETLGALLGAALVALVPHRHGEHGAEEAHGHEGEAFLGEYAERFLALALEVAPFLLLGTLLATSLVLVLPRVSLRSGQGGPGLLLALRGTAFGFVLPACSDGVLSTYQHLRARGAPAIAALAFLLASPVLGVESLLLSLPLLGAELTVARLMGGVLLAVVLGLVVVRALAPVRDEDEPYGSEAHGEHAPRGPLRALRFALREVLDESAAWILVGLAVAAAIEPGSASAWLAQLPPGSDVLLAALLGAPVYLNASGATPLAAALLLAGASPGAALAFLLTSPAMSVPTLGVLGRLHGRGAAALFALLVVGGAFALGVGVNALVPALELTLDPSRSAGPVALTALVVLVSLYGAALLRQGPRRFLGGVLSSEHSHDEELHAHGHGGHAHTHSHHAHAHHHHDHHGEVDAGGAHHEDADAEEAPSEPSRDEPPDHAHPDPMP